MPIQAPKIMFCGNFEPQTYIFLLSRPPPKKKGLTLRGNTCFEPQTVVIGLLVWPVGVNKNTKKDSTQKVTENTLHTQTPFPSSDIDQFLHVGSYPGYLSWFQVSLRAVEKCGSSGGSKFWPSHWLGTSLIQLLVATAQAVILHEYTNM